MNSCLGLVRFKGQVTLETDNLGVLMQEQHYVDTMTNQKIIEGLLNTRIKRDEKLAELINFLILDHNCLCILRIYLVDKNNV